MKIIRKSDFGPKYRIQDMDTGYILHGIIDTKQSHHAIWRPKSDRIVAKLFASPEKALEYAKKMGLTGFNILDDLDNVVTCVPHIRLYDSKTGRLVCNNG